MSASLPPLSSLDTMRAFELKSVLKEAGLDAEGSKTELVRAVIAGVVLASCRKLMLELADCRLSALLPTSRHFQNEKYLRLCRLVVF